VTVRRSGARRRGPPRLARFIVGVVVPEPAREFLPGDLDEQFAVTVRRAGRAAAWRRYWRQALGAIRRARALRARGVKPVVGQHAGSVQMWNLWRDIRLGVRTALRTPGYSVIAIVTLALAIGANTLLFSIANPLVVRPLPIKDSSTLGWIWEDNQLNDVTRGGVSAADFLDMRARAHSFSDLEARESGGGTLTGHGDAEHVTLIRATAGLCDLWGLHPALGRLFQPGEDAVGHPLVGVLSYHYWREAFHQDPTVLGRVLYLDGAPLTVVGVMDPAIEVYGFSTVDLWVPLPLDATLPRDQRNLRVVGRLAPGATIASANAEIRAVGAAQAREHSATNRNWVPGVVATRTAITGPDTWVLLGLLGVVVVFVLLIACANLANLVLARVIRQHHDFAVRLALGASRMQLIRPLVTESLLLGIVGGLVGLGLAHAGLRLINATAYDTLLQQIGIDGNVLIFTAVLSLVTPLLFSLWPALGAGRGGTAETLRDTRTTGGRKAGRHRNVLVAAQVALALSLLVVSGLVLQTIVNIQHADLGLDTRHELTFTVQPPADRYPTDASRAEFARRMIDALDAVPGVTAVAAVGHLPVFDAEITQTLTGTAHDGKGEEDRPWISRFNASPQFFRAAGIPLVAGREFTRADSARATPVAILNRTAADRYFDGVAGALGRTVMLHGRGAADRAVAIVGVVADTRDSTFTRTSPQLYVPFDQQPAESMTVLVRSDAPAGRAAPVHDAMRALDPAVAISTPKTMATLVEENTADNAILNWLFGGFAMLALALAAGGLYGVISYSVGQRQREIGVRMALGAAPWSIRRMVVVESLRITGAGVVVGLVLAWLLGRASASVLYGVSPSDPRTFGAVTALVVAVTLAAVWMPAGRAMRIDPARTLRAE
jgi:putative ABC transport system permease protein